MCGILGLRTSHSSVSLTEEREGTAACPPSWITLNWTATWAPTPSFHTPALQQRKKREIEAKWAHLNILQSWLIKAWQFWQCPNNQNKNLEQGQEKETRYNSVITIIRHHLLHLFYPHQTSLSLQLPSHIPVFLFSLFCCPLSIRHV